MKELGKFIKGLSAAFVLLVPLGASQAAGLGKLSVQSALGQPLVAEIELVSVTAEEAATLRARLASPQAYQEANIDFPAAGGALKFSVEKRANGTPFVRVESTQPVNEPFVDLLVELSWAAGKILREYPVLLDPPGYAADKTAPAPAAPQAAAPTVSVKPLPSAGAEAIQAKPMKSAEPSAGGDNYGPVKKGETLRSIAQGVKPEGVSLEQMLVALYRENRSAFAGKNMNRLKKGVILKVPAQTQAANIEQRTALREISAQTASWNAYRRELAAASATKIAKSDTPSQTAAGQVSSKVVDAGEAPAEPGKDVLKLSRTQGNKGAAKAGDDKATQLQEELVSRDKALGEANSRIAALEKQISEMKRLMELKGSPLPADTGSKAEMTKPGMDKPEVSKPKPTAELKPDSSQNPTTEAGKSVQSPTPEVKPDQPVTTPPAAIEDGKPAPKPKVKRVITAAPPPPQDTDFFSDLLANPMVLGAGVLVLGLLGFLGFRFVKKRRQQPGAFTDTGAIPGGFKPAAAPVAAAAAVTGEDAGNSSFLSDFDKLGAGNIDTDEVDPVAEADVYIAYGRDAQAEEILKEAMSKDASRYEIPMKLLEIYSNRRSVAAYETIAKQLQSTIGTQHPMWGKVAEMGRKLDADNPLYAAVAMPSPVRAVASASAVALAGNENIVPEEPLVPGALRETLTLKEPSDTPPASLDLEFDSPGVSSPGHELDLSPDEGVDIDLNQEAGAQGAKDAMTLDFDLTGTLTKAPTSRTSEPALSEPMAPDLALDFDMGDASPEKPGGPSPAPSSNGLDLSFDLEDTSGNTKPSTLASIERLDPPVRMTPAAQTPTASQVDLPPLDLSGIDLNLGKSEAPLAEPANHGGGNWQSAATKLDLARAYLEIGDKMGALEILQEVMKEGSPEQQAEAKTLASQAA